MERLKNSTAVLGVHPEVPDFLNFLRNFSFFTRKCFEMVVNPNIRGKLSKLWVNHPGY
jgi:hypothetical protein